MQVSESISNSISAPSVKPKKAVDLSSTSQSNRQNQIQSPSYESLQSITGTSNQLLVSKFHCFLRAVTKYRISR